MIVIEDHCRRIQIYALPPGRSQCKMNDNKHVSKRTHTHDISCAGNTYVYLRATASTNQIFIARAKGRCAKKEELVRIHSWLRDKCTYNGLRNADRNENRGLYGLTRYNYRNTFLRNNLTQLTGARERLSG